MKYTVSSELLPEKLQAAGLDVMAVSATELDRSYLEQIIEKSRQPHIQQYEGPEDVGTSEVPGRFRSIEDYRRWAENKQRFLFMLINQHNVVKSDGVPDVAGISWFGQREHPYAPGRSITFAMRNYAADFDKGWKQYTGKGLAVPFMQVAHEQASNIFPGKRLWLDLVADNEASRRMCESANYIEIARFNDSEHMNQERIVMVNDNAFMSK